MEWLAAINDGGGQVAFPAAHGLFPIDSVFSFCSYTGIGESRREFTGMFEKI